MTMTEFLKNMVDLIRIISSSSKIKNIVTNSLYFKTKVTIYAVLSLDIHGDK